MVYCRGEEWSKNLELGMGRKCHRSCCKGIAKEM